MPRLSHRLPRRRASFAAFRRRGAGAGTALFLAGLALVAAPVRAAEALPPDGVRGLPFTRSYPLEEIGNVPRGARLSFDPFDRVALVYDGVYTVLNDTTWLELAEPDTAMSHVVRGPAGRLYCGTLGKWGVVETTPAGKLRPRYLQPATVPHWVEATSFNEIVPLDDAVGFGGLNGVALFDPRTGESRLLEQPSVSRLFALGGELYVCANGRPIQRVDRARGELRVVDGGDGMGFAPEFATALDERRMLLAARDGRLRVFDGRTVTEWAGQRNELLAGRISAVSRLVDGGVALALNGRGLFLATAEGEVFAALTSPEYHRVESLATREAGVLWVTTESAVEKVLYGGPLTLFSQRLGLPMYWPTVLPWRGRILVETRGRLFEATPGARGLPASFTLLKTQPAGGAWSVGTNGRDLLVGNANGVFEFRADGTFAPVLPGFAVMRLVWVAAEHCFIFGRDEIAVVHRAGDRWEECAPRIATVGFPSMISVAHASARAAWIELGGRRVARLRLADGRIRAQVFDDFPWPDPKWINVGIVDDTIVLTGPGGSRAFYDERAEKFTDAPALRDLLARSPDWALRMSKDATGALWVTHAQGVTVFAPDGAGGWQEPETIDLLNDRFPVVNLLPGGDVWIASGQALYRVDRTRLGKPRPPLRPRLVSVVDGRADAELLRGPGEEPAALRLPYAQNNLSLRFFSGSYAWRRAPAYEFRLGGANDRWTSLGAGSLLNLPAVREGSYRLEVRVAGAVGAPTAGTELALQILPPWYRTWGAYLLYGAAAGAAVFGLVRWSGRRAQRRNAQLEKLVAERTEQLTATMAQLNEETRTGATLAERDRLAGEIHDSLQQGLSGLILQLDATLKLPALTPDVRSRLDVARNMVSFTRHEVQHAIWDLESPLLEGADLAEALRKIAGLISAGGAPIDVAVTGDPVELPSATKHHLLRIAQEAITNAVRHGAPRAIAVRLDYGPRELVLAVRDDGVGFDPAAVLAPGVGHFGLRGLRGRAAKIRGELKIDSAPGRGTTVRVAVPVGSE